jgi:glycogen(starch) synthase
MKILEIMACTLPSDGYGAARYAEGLSRGLSELGHEIHMLSVGRSEGREDERHGVKIHHLGLNYGFFAYNDQLQNVLENLPLSDGLVDLWDRHGPFDVVLAHDWTSSLAGTLAQRVFQTRLISILHGCQVGRGGGKGTKEELFVADVERWLCERSDQVIVESDLVRNELQRHYLIPREKISLVPAPMDARTFNADVDTEDFRSLFATSGESIVLFAGRLIPAKGPDLFVETVRHVLKERPKTQGVIAGHGSMHGALAKQIEDLGLASRVRMTGHLGPLVLGALYQVADVLVVPSRYESLGIVVLEAAMHGLPVVAPQEGALGELGESLRREQLRLVPLDPRRLASAVTGILGDEKSARGATGADANRLPLKYRYEKGARELAEIAETLLSTASGSRG